MSHSNNPSPAQREKEQNLAQFAESRGLITDAEVLGHLHAGLRSAPQTKTYQRWNRKRLEELQDARDMTRRLYREAVASGEIIDPDADQLARLKRTASGHPDNAATHAAQRLLAKRFSDSANV